MIAIAYIRRSAKSEEKTVSLEDQSRHIADYCERVGLVVAETVSHDGVSGGERKRFTPINAAIKRHSAGALVFYNLDRLARDVAGMLDQLRAWHKQGLAVHEATMGHLDLNNPVVWAMLGFRGVSDELSKNITGLKTKHALEGLKLKGRQYSRIPPFGYAYIQGKLEANAEEQNIISQVLALRGHTSAAIEDKIRATGYRGRLSLSTVQRLLRRS